MSSVLLALAAAAASPPTGRPIVVGGTPVVEGEWPDAAALLFRDQFACSAVLIAPELVLTAGHCFGSPYSLDKRVLLNTTNYVLGGDSVDIVDQHLYPDPLSTFDIAVFELAEPALVAPRPLLLDCLADDWLVEGAEVTIAGFGSIDPDGAPGNTALFEARTHVRVPACSDAAAGCNPEVFPDGELIAGGNGVDSCVGDSGGPLYLHTPDLDYLVGITSRAARPNDSECGDGGIYVRIDAVADWIESVTGQALERPTCQGMARPPRPVAPSIEVALGTQASVVVDPQDPNEGDLHTFTIVRQPRVGEARIDAVSGELRYQAPGTLAFDSFVIVEVTDATGLSGQVTLDIHILEEPAPLELEPRRGCRGADMAGWASLLLGPFALRRSRRRRTARAAV